ncbi:DNA replication protein [Maublancomyces gigas]|uniref:DNA replication complex GINS protein PSF3 n=1 Tax=Discina gigas TaxID=1032678 RepID=A0ABR3GEE0_9PEZI
MSYYDIDAILTDAQKVPCIFEITIPGLGYLEGNSNTDIKQGTRVELPLWLGEMLGVSQRLGTMTNVVSLDLPTALAPRIQNALKADPRTVDLRALASHYYSLGERILGLLEEDELVDILTEALWNWSGAELVAGIQAFKKRAAEIADHAHNPTGAIGGGGGDFLKGLDENERHRESIATPPGKDLLNYLQSSEQHMRVRRRSNSF